MGKRKRRDRRISILLKILILSVVIYGIYVINDTTIAVGVLYNRGQF